MKLRHIALVLVVSVTTSASAIAQSRLMGDQFSFSAGNLPNSFGVTVDLDTDEVTDHGSPAVTLTVDGTTQVAGGMNVTPTATEWPGLEGGIPVKHFAGINIEDDMGQQMMVNDLNLPDWENVGEVVEFTYETVNGGYIAQDNDFGPSFSVARGLDWANSVPGSMPQFFETGFFFYWTNQDVPLTGMRTLMPEIGLFVGAHPTKPDVPEVVYIGYSQGQVMEVTEPLDGGMDFFTSTTQLAPGASWDDVGQVMGLPIFGENEEGMPADGFAIGFLVVPPEAAVSDDVCGDFDRDGDVDTADRNTQVTNWSGALMEGGTATFEQGDCDADGDVDTADQNGLINNWTGAQNNAGNLSDGGDADLIYDPNTGNVTLDATDTASDVFISFVLATTENNMRTENLVESIPENAGPFFDVGTNTDNKPFQIGQTDPLNQGAGPLVDLGDIFPAGMDLAGLHSYLSLADYASELGAGGQLDLRLVPEPSSAMLALLGLIALCRTRRRRV